MDWLVVGIPLFGLAWFIFLLYMSHRDWVKKMNKRLYYEKIADLTTVERRVVSEILSQPNPRPSTVIPAVAAEFPTEARHAYWRLLNNGIVDRALNGRLTVREPSI